LRRYALGVIRILTEKALPLDLDWLLKVAAMVLHNQKISGTVGVEALAQSLEVTSSDLWSVWRLVKLHYDYAAALKFNEVDVSDFIYGRLAGSLREDDHSAQEVDAVLALHPQRFSDVSKRLVAVRSFASMPEAQTLAAANKRVSNILKKVEDEERAEVDEHLLNEPAEIALSEALAAVKPRSDAAFERGDYTASLQALAALKAPVDAFFETVMVNAEDPALRANRLGLLAQLHAAMNRVADLSKLAA